MARLTRSANRATRSSSPLGTVPDANEAPTAPQSSPDTVTGALTSPDVGRPDVSPCPGEGPSSRRAVAPDRYTRAAALVSVARSTERAGGSVPGIVHEPTI